MTHTHRLPRLLLALAATVLAALAVTAVAPRAADAQSCPFEDFCLWEHVNYQGGRYNWSGNDANLWNDKFVGTNVTVAENASALYNNGNPRIVPSVVALYGRNGFLGACVPAGRGIANLVNPGLNDVITGFRWVNHC